MLSEELYLERLGNFTASENHRLMAGWDKPQPSRDFEYFDNVYGVIKPLFDKGESKFLVGDLSSKFNFKLTGDLIKKTLEVIKGEIPPTGLVTYAEEKALETLFDLDPSLNFSNQHTLNGEERELECMQLLSSKTGLEFHHTGEEQIHIHANEVGCTPDGVIYDELDLVSTGAEVKCKSPLVHARNLLVNNSQDMKEALFEHYVQVQTAMLVTGSDYWYFANYNPFAKKESHKFKYIVVDRDIELINILKQRIEIAKQIKADFLRKLEESEINIKHDMAA
jgi:hypothetical protein